MALSVISGTSCSPSILKVGGNRSRSVPQRVRFRLPDDLRTILIDFINQKCFKPYEELVCILKESEIQVSIWSDVHRTVVGIKHIFA